MPYIGPQPVPQATQTRQVFTATASQTSFPTMGYTPGYVDVYLNGVKLVDGDDYTATNGSDIVLTVGAALDDVLDVVAYRPFSVAEVPQFVTTVTANYTVPASNVPTTVNVNAGSATITLPAADVIGRRVTVRKVSASAGTVSTQRAGSDTIDGGTSAKSLKAQFGSATFEVVASGSWSMVHRYEEGTWTPGLTVEAGSVTYGTRVGMYTLSNNDVKIWASILATGSATATLSDVTGLPYVAAVGGTNYSGPAIANAYNVSLGTGGTALGGYYRDGETAIRFHSYGNNTGQLTPSVTAATVFELRFEGVYRTDD